MYESPEELDAFFKALFDIKKDRILGTGAFGLAVLALDETEQIKKVFKLPKEERTTEALKIEGKNLRKLEELLSPNIVRLYKYGRVEIEWRGCKEERYYLCLAFGGTSLRQKLGDLRAEYDPDGNASYHGSGRRLPLEEALRISIEVCQGLEAAHGFRDSEVRIIHRDIKPENILIDDETGTARITDFGISRVIDRSTGICSVAGTLLYMDPECFKGHAGPFSDLYSLGMVMYEMFTGQLPFENFQMRVHCPPADPRKYAPDMPEALVRVILRAMEVDLSRRYANATEMVGDLKKVGAALNPLPAQYSKIESLGYGRFLCDEGGLRQRVIVHLVESEATLGDMAKEAAVIEEVQSPCIISPIKHFRNEHMLGIVSAPTKGASLAETLGKCPVMGADRIKRFCELMAMVGDAMVLANARGIVHGHLAPQHVRCDGNRGVLLYGYGMAPVFRSRPPGSVGATAVINAFGDSLAFMSPQVLSGGPSLISSDDVFSIGAVMYSLLTGQPHATQDVLKRLLCGEVVAQSLKNPRESNPQISKRLAGILVRSLDWNVHNRPGTVADIVSALRECQWPGDLVDTLVGDALQHYHEGDVVRAYELLDQALDADPGNDRIHLARGTIYYGEKEYRWAAEEIQKAASVAPTHEAYALLGRCFMDWEGHGDQAVEMFREALHHGESAEVRHFLARVLQERGQLAEAVEQMERSIAVEADESIRKRREFQLREWRNRGGAPGVETVTQDRKKERGHRAS